MNKPNVVAIIPARGGSKSIPRKNIKPLGGQPLIAWPIKLAQSIKQIDRIIVSSEDAEIIKIAKKYGAEVPFIRPMSLCQDDTATLPVLQHAVRYLQDKENYSADIILLFYAINPFLRKERVEEGLRYLANKDVDSVIGMKEVRNRVWKYYPGSKKYLPYYPKVSVNRQYLKHLYEEAGNIYFTKKKVMLKQNKLINEKKCRFIFVNEDETIDIDNPSDWQAAEEYVKKLQR